LLWFLRPPRRGLNFLPDPELPERFFGSTSWFFLRPLVSYPVTGFGLWILKTTSLMAITATGVSRIAREMGRLTKIDKSPADIKSD
jgi:hypothetical protein